MAGLRQREGRHGGHPFAFLDGGHAGAKRIDHAGGLVADARRKYRALVIDALTQHDLGPVEADRLDPDADLAGAGIALRYLLQAQYLGPAGLVKSHNSYHLRAPTDCVELPCNLI